MWFIMGPVSCRCRSFSWRFICLQMITFFIHVPPLGFLRSLTSLFGSRFGGQLTCCFAAKRFDTCLVAATKGITVSFDVQREDTSCSLLKELCFSPFFFVSFSFISELCSFVVFDNVTNGNVYLPTFPVRLNQISKHLLCC